VKDVIPRVLCGGAREMEIVRIKGALQRVEELSDDVAAAIERDSLKSDNYRL
jgi:hypothetical protein